MPIVPVADLGQRMVEHGRIRLGIQTKTANGKTKPTSIDTFRFTSADRHAIAQLAEQFGGTARPWENPKASPSAQWEVVSDAKQMPVWVLPGGLSTWYELWSGGGCVRRCDGIECITSQQTFDPDFIETKVGCICDRAGKLECKPTTRLSVIIPSIRFGGSWRLESHGWNAAEEMPGMVAMIEQLQESGVLRGELRLERRQSQGGRRSFVVPALLIDVAPEQMLTGGGDVRAALAAPTQDTPALPPAGGAPSEAPPPPPALSSAPTVPPPWAADDEISDAELVDDDEALFDPYSLPHAPRDPVALTPEQVEGLRSGRAKWSSATEGRVVKA